MGHERVSCLRPVWSDGVLLVSGLAPDRDQPPPAPIAAVDPDVKHPRVDEWSLGLEHQFGANWRVSATGVYRENKNFMGRVLPDARWEQITLNTTASTPISDCEGCSAWPGGTTTAYRWSNRDTSNNNLLITNPDGFQYRDLNGNLLGTMDANRNYKALMLTVDRRLANRWQGQVSYVRSEAKGTVNNASRSLFRSTSNFYETPTLGLVNADGVTTNDRPNEVKAFVGWEIPKIEVSLGGTYTLLSGTTYAPFQVYPSSQINYSATAYYLGFSSAGRQPLLEPRAPAARPTEHVVDLRLAKVFKVGFAQRSARRLRRHPRTSPTRARCSAVLSRVPDHFALHCRLRREPGTSEDVAFEAPSLIRDPRQVVLGARSELLEPSATSRPRA